jgi:predicted RNase H-like nuclease
LGVDACRVGWVGILLGDTVRAYIAASIAQLVSAVALHSDVAVIAVDIPIGLADSGPRLADIEARRAAGVRRSSVFMTPVRAALHVEDYPSALLVNRQLAGTGFSIQAFGLKPKILEVDAWVRRTDRHVVEVHPEVSFARMAGEPLADSKTTWAGMIRRQSLLASKGIELTGDLGAAGRRAGVDDVLDAGAAAWSARRVARGEAICLPSRPETFSDGLPSAIWV